MSVLYGEKLSSIKFSITFTEQAQDGWQTRYGFGRDNLVSCKAKGLSGAKEEGRIPVFKCGQCTEQELRQAKDKMAREMRQEDSDDEEEEDDDDE